MKTPVPGDLSGLRIEFPALRALMRRFLRGPLSAVELAYLSGSDLYAMFDVARAFCAGGYVGELGVDSAGEKLYAITMRGRSLAMRGLRRFDLKRIQAVKARLEAAVLEMASDPDMEFEVSVFGYFGSSAWPEGKSDFGDVDVIIDFGHKPEYRSFQEAHAVMEDRLKDAKLIGAETSYGSPSWDTRTKRYIKDRVKASNVFRMYRLGEIESYQFEHLITYDRLLGGWLPEPLVKPRGVVRETEVDAA